MNLLDLKYFIAVADEKSYTAAAKKLFVTQQALSQHIAKLEKKYGVELFSHTVPLTLTEAGKLLYTGATRLFYDQNQIEASMQDIKDASMGTLTIGTPTSRGLVMLDLILPEFQKLYPHIKVSLYEGTTKEIMEALYAGKTDLNLGFAVYDQEQVVDVPLYDEKIVLMVPEPIIQKYLIDKSSELESGSIQDLEVFKNIPFLQMKNKSWLREIHDECCDIYNINPFIACESVSIPTLIALSLNGLGAVLLPETFAKRRQVITGKGDWKHSVRIFYPDKEFGYRAITISYLKNHYLTHAANGFIQIVKKAYILKP